MKNIETILQGIGLSENESKIYLALLKLGKSGITNISKKSNIKRTTIYSYITPLLEKEFIKRTIYGKRILFTAENPTKLVSLFEERKRKFIEKLPVLEGLYNENSPNPNLEFYEGKKAINEIYKKIWSAGLTIYTFFSPEEFYKYFSEEFDKTLGSADIKTKTLIKNNNFSKRHIQNNPTSQIKFLPKNFELDVDIIIIGNSIIMISFSPMYCIVLKNKPLANFHRNLHNYFWNI